MQSLFIALFLSVKRMSNEVIQRKNTHKHSVNNDGKDAPFSLTHHRFSVFSSYQFLSIILFNQYPSYQGGE